MSALRKGRPTPGSWIPKNYSVWSKPSDDRPGVQIANLHWRMYAHDRNSIYPESAEALANARFMAAAPDLYRAAHAALIAITDNHDGRMYTDAEKTAIDLLILAIRDADGGDDEG